MFDRIVRVEGSEALIVSAGSNFLYSSRHNRHKFS